MDPPHDTIQERLRFHYDELQSINKEAKSTKQQLQRFHDTVTKGSLFQCVVVSNCEHY